MNEFHQLPGTELIVVIPGICAVVGTFVMIFAG